MPTTFPKPHGNAENVPGHDEQRKTDYTKVPSDYLMKCNKPISMVGPNHPEPKPPLSIEPCNILAPWPDLSDAPAPYANV